MPSAARLGDSIAGTTAGEHSGHATPHSPLPITGSISGNCSGDVCGSSQGSVGAGSGTVFINGHQAARVGDALNAHNGTGQITGGSGDVSFGG